MRYALVVPLLLIACQEPQSSSISTPSAPPAKVEAPRALIRMEFAADAPTPQHCTALPDMLPPDEPVSPKDRRVTAVSAHNRRFICTGYRLRDHLKELDDQLHESEELVVGVEDWNATESLPSGFTEFFNDLDYRLGIHRLLIVSRMGYISSDVSYLQDEDLYLMKEATELGLPFLSRADVFQAFKDRIAELQVRAQLFVERLDEQREKLKEHPVAPVPPVARPRPKKS